MQAHIGHVGTGGIQGHSAGPLMPWTIVVQGMIHTGIVFALNGSDGRRTTGRPFGGESGQTFRDAQAAARLDAEAELKAEFFSAAA